MLNTPVAQAPLPNAALPSPLARVLIRPKKVVPPTAVLSAPVASEYSPTAVLPPPLAVAAAPTAVS